MTAPHPTSVGPLAAGWLRRNRWFLIALAVLIPVSFVVSLLPRFVPYLQNRPVAIEVARGEVVRYSGTDVQLTALEVLDGGEVNARAGADVVVATLAIDVIDPPEVALCDVYVVAPIDGVERRWDDAIGSSGYEVPDYFEQYCDLTQKRRYHLQLVFDVPRGEVPDPVVVFRSSQEAPRELRLH